MASGGPGRAFRTKRGVAFWSMPDQDTHRTSTGPVSPGLANALRSLAESQLQIQASRSAALDASAIGVAGIDVALGGIALVDGFGQPLRLAVLALVSLSAGLAARALFLDGTPHLGPSVMRVLATRKIRTDRVLEDAILSDLGADVRANGRALARKAPYVARAFGLLTLAAMLTLAGRIH